MPTLLKIAQSQFETLTPGVLVVSIRDPTSRSNIDPELTCDIQLKVSLGKKCRHHRKVDILHVVSNTSTRKNYCDMECKTAGVKYIENKSRKNSGVIKSRIMYALSRFTVAIEDSKIDNNLESFHGRNNNRFHSLESSNVYSDVIVNLDCLQVICIAKHPRPHLIFVDGI